MFTFTTPPVPKNVYYFGMHRFLLGVAAPILIACFFVLSSAAAAQGANDTIVNQDCVGVVWIPKCGCGEKLDSRGNCIPGGKNKRLCKCKESANDFTASGKCVAPGQCRADFAQGADGKNALDQAMGILKGLLDKLMQGGQGGAGGKSAAPGTTGTGQTLSSIYPPCQINPATNTITSVPCVDSTGAVITSPQTGNLFVSGTGTASSVANSLLNALGDTDESAAPASPVSSLLESSIATVGAQDTRGTNPSLSSETATGIPTPDAHDIARLEPDMRGDIVTSGVGATVVAGARDVAGNTEVSGFIGSNVSTFSQPTTLVGRLCEARPWATGFLASIVSPAFFDGLCVWRGHHVGTLPSTPAPAAQHVLKQTAPAVPSDDKDVPSAATGGPPAVDVWASPASVSLGTRTSIFWASRGVATCRVEGPSFKQEGLSGGAATVPISGTSVFTAVCLDGEGNEVARDSVTVNLAI